MVARPIGLVAARLRGGGRGQSGRGCQECDRQKQVVKAHRGHSLPVGERKTLKSGARSGVAPLSCAGEICSVRPPCGYGRRARLSAACIPLARPSRGAARRRRHACTQSCLVRYGPEGRSAKRMTARDRIGRSARRPGRPLDEPRGRTLRRCGGARNLGGRDRGGARLQPEPMRPIDGDEDRENGGSDAEPCR